MTGHTIESLTYQVDLIESERLRIIISKNNIELGSLYYEKAKRSFNKKPISMNSWACVDAKVEGLYEVENITPIEVMNKCQEIIRGAGL
jgi:hypothetical protein